MDNDTQQEHPSILVIHETGFRAHQKILRGECKSVDLNDFEYACMKAYLYDKQKRVIEEEEILKIKHIIKNHEVTLRSNLFPEENVRANLDDILAEFSRAGRKASV